MWRFYSLVRILDSDLIVPGCPIELVWPGESFSKYMKILCDRCKREFELDVEPGEKIYSKTIEIICPDCEHDSED